MSQREAARVLGLRTLLGFSQHDFAKLTGSTPASVSRWERGTSPPTGTAAQVITAVELVLRKHSDRQVEVLLFIQESVDLGGLAVLLINLFDAKLEKK